MSGDGPTTGVEQITTVISDTGRPQTVEFISPPFGGRTDVAPGEFIRQRDFAIEVLAKEGFLEKDTTGNIICDLEKFRSYRDWNTLRDKLGSISRPQGSRINTVDTLVTIFDGLPVYSQEDYRKLQQGEAVVTRSLFYIPQNKEAALSIEEIKKARFYLGLWEFKRIGPGEFYPTQDEGFQSKLSFHSGTTSALIYHPDYGDGIRASDSVLKVKWRNGERKPISSGFFGSWDYSGEPGNREQSTTNGPAEFFLTRCPDMVEAGLIKPYEDFQIIYSQKALGPSLRQPTSSGMIMFDGVRYIIGREYSADRGYVAYKLSDKYAGIFQRNEEGKYTLAKIIELRKVIPGEEGIGTTKNSKGQEHVLLHKDQYNSFTPAEMAKKQSDMVDVLGNIEKFLEFSQRVSRETDLSLINLSLKEQVYAANLYLHYGNDERFWGFIKKFKLDGLRSLMVSEGSYINVELMWEIGEKDQNADKIFQAAAGIVSAVTQYEDEVRESLNPKEQAEADIIAQTIMQNAGRLVLASVPVLRSKAQLYDTIDIIVHLRSFGRQVSDMYRKYYLLGEGDQRYQQLLNVFNQPGDVNQRAMIMALLQEYWLADAGKETQQSVQGVLAESDAFYLGEADKLYEKANETTGDTKEQLHQFHDYVDGRNIAGRSIRGTVVDMGCGNIKRITEPMAKMMPGAKIIAIDRLPVDYPVTEQIEFRQGDFTKMPVEASSAELVTAHWSVVNDLLMRTMQISSLDEVVRVLREGGEFYLDVPHLEGGEGSWEPAAKAYREKHPDQPYGMIKAAFPGGSTKEFYIYPEAELIALLESRGFAISHRLEWRTQSGKPRLTLVARLETKVTPARLRPSS